jgi:hypothetical protein
MMMRRVAVSAVFVVGIIFGGAAAWAQTVPVPPQLQPVLAAFGPAAAPACGAAGLLGSVLAGQANGAALYQLLSPVYEVCAYLPPSSAPAVCPGDQPVLNAIRAVAPALGSLLPLPKPVGQTVDTVTAIDALVKADTGQSLPEQTRTLLLTATGCTYPVATPPPSGHGSFDLTPPGESVPMPAVEGSTLAGSLAPPGTASDLQAALAPSGTSGAAATGPSPLLANVSPAAIPDDWRTRVITVVVLFLGLLPLVARNRALRR